MEKQRPPKTSRWQRLVQPHLESPRYVPFVAGISALNTFIPFFPVELFIVLRVRVRPKEWLRLALIAAVASLLGTLLLAILIDSNPQAGFSHWLAERVGPDSWRKVTDLIQKYGVWGLALGAITFVPLPPAVIVCVMSKVPNWQIAAAVGLGNGLKYTAFAWTARRSTGWFGKPKPEVVPAE